ncbi:hypothetical protein ACQUJN_24215, partial [Ralstonia pseudosolanacearum]
PPAASSRAARNAHRSSPRAGSRLSCGDVMGYVILNSVKRRINDAGEQVEYLPADSLQNYVTGLFVQQPLGPPHLR